MEVLLYRVVGASVSFSQIEVMIILCSRSLQIYSVCFLFSKKKKKKKKMIVMHREMPSITLNSRSKLLNSKLWKHYMLLLILLINWDVL